MIQRKSSMYRLTIVLGVLVIVGLTVYLISRYMNPTVQAQSDVEKMEKAYEKGRKAFDAVPPDYKEAKKDFEEAKKYSTTAVDDVEVLSRGSSKPSNELRGKVFKYRAQALRDYWYASAAAEGRPMSELESTDSISKEKFLSYEKLSALSGSDTDRDIAIAALFRAANFLDEDAELQKDALRSLRYMGADPRNRDSTYYENLDHVCHNLIKLSENDPSANYQMAEIEFYQPGFGTPPAPESRDVNRIKKARDYLQAVRKNKIYPYWRVTYLDLQISDWFIKYGKAKGALTPQEPVRLDTLLFGPDGVMDRAASGKGLNDPTLSPLDVGGAMKSVSMLVRRRAEEYKADEKKDPANLLAAVKAMLNASKILYDSTSAETLANTGVLLDVGGEMIIAQAVMGYDGFVRAGERWASVREEMLEVGHKALEKKKSGDQPPGVHQPDAYARIGDVVDREAFYIRVEARAPWRNRGRP